MQRSTVSDDIYLRYIRVFDKPIQRQYFSSKISLYCMYILCVAYFCVCLFSRVCGFEPVPSIKQLSQGQYLVLSPFNAPVLPICTQVKRPQVYNWNFKVCTARRDLRVLNTPFLISANKGVSHEGEKLSRGINKQRCTISCRLT